MFKVEKVPTRGPRILVPGPRLGVLLVSRDMALHHDTLRESPSYFNNPAENRCTPRIKLSASISSVPLFVHYRGWPWGDDADKAVIATMNGHFCQISQPQAPQGG